MKIGEFVQQPKGFKAFIPGKFPPVDSFIFSKLTEQLHARASLLVGKLDGVTRVLVRENFTITKPLKKTVLSQF